MTTKKVHLKSILHELLWFIRGDTNIRYLVENGVGIWNDWPYQSWLRRLTKKRPTHVFAGVEGEDEGVCSAH